MSGDAPGAAEGGTFDWDAAFEAIVAPLRRPVRYRPRGRRPDTAFEALVAPLRASRRRQVARAVGAAVVAASVIVVTWMLLAQVLAAQARGIAQPVR